MPIKIDLSVKGRRRGMHKNSAEQNAGVIEGSDKQSHEYMEHLYVQAVMALKASGDQ
jgi:hypothetical protein